MKLLTAILLSAGILSPAFAAAPAVPAKAAAAKAAAVKVTSVEGITEYRLANGLRVLLFPDASKPTLTTNIVYMVGSRHENYGETGMAHLLEHLLFKPTANFGIKKGSKTPVEVLNQTGGRFNGTTWYDRTNYFSTFPANDDNLKLMLELEADRMVNSPISQDDLWNNKTQKGEMTVVRNEFERGESDPFRVTLERTMSVAFDWHNYGKSTIGARSDIEGVSIDRLRAFYQRYYQPDNAILMVAGRFDEARVLAQINELFGKIPKPTRVLAPTYTAEPTQDGERSVTIRRTGGTQIVAAGYHVAPASHDDAAALQVLGRILSEAPGGRLHKALVDAKLASSVMDLDFNQMEPGYRLFAAVVPKDGQTAAVEEAMLKALEDIKSNPLTAAEVERAKASIAKDIDQTVNDTARFTIALTSAQAAGDWRLFHQRRDQVEKIDVAAVQAVALKYLKPANRTLARFIPTEGADRTEVPKTPDVAALVKDYKGRAAVAQGEVFDPSPDNIEKRTQRSVLANGMKLALLPKSTKGNTVSASIQLRMGTAENLAGKAIIGDLTASLLLSGTERLSRQEVKDALDKLKANVNVNGGAEGVTVNLTTTRDNLAAALDLLGESLMKPALTAKDFSEQQRDMISGTEQQLTEPQPLASNAMRRLTNTFPAGHPHHTMTLPEQLAEQKAATLEQVKAFHKAYYGAGNATLSVVGDFDIAAVQAQAARLFGNWKAEQPYVRIASEMKQVAGQAISLETPDKANSVLFAIQPVPMKDDAAAYPALLMGNYMLGGGALRSRLADRIRQKEGLSYGVGSQLSVPSRDPAGLWLAFAISAPQNTAKVEAALREELSKALKDGFTDAELADAKKAWLQSQQVGRTGDASLAGRLASYLSFERTMAFEKDLEAKVSALTVAQVNEALRAHLKPEAVSVIKAGDFAKAAAGAAGAAPASKP
ncbi:MULTISPECIES: pitrilysin family protein [unclassified Duganella]|uniref:M16 family metallopeptidase n=1 Tax=unclassified Duganella TaxID=2636909 RepID=UPI0006F4DD32|nr:MULTISPECIES: pitrilysin family protein [unclassified Duganella]KQV44933.1 Zn-dependent peptidase [Duganella sp. Root336D2]KRB92953.1 Zn-dependent peptidase [Duganella sp. Root198D2]